jgi:hypothetical protein
VSTTQTPYPPPGYCIVTGPFGEPELEACSAPASGSGSTPASGSGSTPASGSGSTPASGSGSTPASGSGSTPASGSGSTPASGSGSSTSSGSGSTTPAKKPADEFAGDFDAYCADNPDDPICSVWYSGSGGVTYTSPIGGTTGGTTVVINESGATATDISGVVNTALNGLWESTRTGVDDAISAVVNETNSALTSIGNALTSAWNILSRLGGLILSLLSSMWTSIIKGLIAAVQELKKLVQDVLDDVIQPMLKALHDLRDWLIKFYQNWLRPMLIILQDLRKLLAILKLFGVKFAGKLDSALADIQSRITAPLFYLLSFTNAIANWVNLIVTAGYLFQRPIFLSSLNAYVGESINLQLNAMTQPISAGGAAAIAAQASAPTAKQSTADFHTFLTSSSGPYATYATDYGAVLQDALNGKVTEPGAAA